MSSNFRQNSDAKLSGFLIDEPLYQPFYCEENMWHLCQSPGLQAYSPHVVFISNANRACMFFEQAQAAPHVGLVWDYHVITVAVAEDVWVFDLDTRLSMPCRLLNYLAGTFSAMTPTPYLPRFRVLSAAQYLSSFSSDRSHMHQGNHWLQPPPPWPPLILNDVSMNLDEYVTLRKGGPGMVMEADMLQSYFLRK
jgi:protein N-terminal glutamine amidohydrolase